MTTLSVVVSVYNGEKYLAECLDSVKHVAQEIIVVDHESTDKTVSIAKKFTKKIYHQKNNPDNIDLQKNFGLEKATSDWILVLDTDERLTPELGKEIQKTLATNTQISGFTIPRKNIIFGKWIEHTGWYPDYQVRLFKKGKGKYPSKHVHEQIAIDGPIETLVSPFVHENYQTIYQFLHRDLTIYAPNEAEALRANGYIFSYADALRFPFKEFLSRFFAREGYLDGFHGLMLSLLMACYHFAIFCYLWEYEKFPTDTNGRKLLSKELPEIAKEYHYWEKTAQIHHAKNPTKILLKIKRKIGL